MRFCYRWPKGRLLALALAATCASADAAPIQSVVSYESSVTSDGGGPISLAAELNYDPTNLGAPIAVVMHGYSGSSGKMAEVRANAQRLRDAGFFAISVALRGRDGSDGTRDSGGVEIFDIYDAVEHVKTAYPNLVDTSNVHITGYSGGGGNVMSAVTKFPDYFRAGSSYFGMSDYGYDTEHGWHFDGASGGHQNQMNADIGNPTLGNPNIQDRYMARASNLASRNNPYSEIHLFVNHNEVTCPPINHTSFRDNAVAAAATPGEFDKITVHIGGQGQYVDFNGNGASDASELQSWPHGYPDANEQRAAEGHYLSRLLDGSIAEPVLNEQDNLFVAGFVVTKRFSLWLGDGQNAAAELQYDLTGEAWTFDMELLSNNKSIDGVLKVDTSELAGQSLTAWLNGEVVEQFVGGGTYQLAGFGHNDAVTISPVKPGDFNGDGAVDGADFVIWQTNFPATSGAMRASGDANGDGAVDGADFVIWQTNFPSTVPVLPASVPEPAAAALALAAAVAAACVRRFHSDNRGTTIAA